MSNLGNIRIVGSASSTCTRRVIYTAALLNIPIQLVEIDWAKGQHKSPEHLAKQPFGKVPVLEQGDFTLFESRAISRYLNDLSTTHALVPQDIKQKALFEQWEAVELGTLNPLIDTIVYNSVFYKYHGATADTEALKQAHEKIKQPLTILDRQLSKYHYVVNNQISLVDIFLVPNLWVIRQSSPEDGKQLIDAYPNIAAWWKRVTGTPEWQKIAGTPSV